MSFFSPLKNLTSYIPGRKLVETALDKTEDAAKSVVQTTKQVAETVEDTFESAVDGAQKVAGSALDKTKDVFEDVADTLEGALDKVQGAYSGRIVHGPLKEVPHSQLKLKADFSDLKRVQKLEASGAFTPVSLGSLPLDRTTVTGGDVPSTGMKNQSPVAFSFNEEDQNTHDWYPQAVTTSADADGKSGKLDGKSWMAVSWYHKNEPRSRISLIDNSDPKQPGKYRNVELMVPDAKTGKLAPLESHVGGVTMSGNYLYVAQTGGGIRVFDVRHLLKVQDKSQVPPGTEPYVLPQVGYYKVQGAPGETAHAGSGSSPLFSGLSMDRTGTRPALLSQEYDAENPGGRIIRWEIDPKTGKLAEKDGVVQATNAWAVPMTRVAGVARLEDGFRIATMGTPANLFEAREGERPQRMDSLAQGIQQFSHDWTQNKVWTLAEHPGRRVVWAFEP